MQDTNKDINIALLVDVDNIAWRYTESILSELSKYGKVTIRRLYGDWSQARLKGWLTIAQKYSLTPIMQPNNTPGKNASDIGLIIDAMDILYSGQCDGFVLVSSDSDFTRLAIRLREAGMYVIGMGEKKTPNPFIVACDKFIYIEVLREREQKAADAAKKKKAEKQKKAESQKTAKASKPGDKTADKLLPDKFVPDEIEQLIADSIADIAEDDGFADLSDLGNLLIKKQPDFDPRNYGFGKLSNMLRSLPRFEVVVRTTPDPNVKPIFIRDVDA
jgi:hypothetical protein